MAKKAAPWYWEARNGWYVLVSGQRHFLGEHPVGAPKPQKSKKTGKWNSPPDIDDAFRRLLDGDAPAPIDDEALITILDDFITWCEENRSEITAFRYQEFCQDFVEFAPDDGGLQFGQLSIHTLTSKHVTKWLNAHPTWGPTTKRNAITALQRGFNWAVKNRGLDRNPIRGMEKPDAKTRTDILTPEEFEQVLSAIPDDRFRELLIVSYDSGARPFEVKELEARHVQVDKRRAVIPKEEAKGKKHPRAFYFPTARSMDIVERRRKQFPNGPLFRNRLGRKWTASAVKCRLEDLDHVLGRRVTHYALRHSFITRKLVAGVDSHVVAKLAGHRDTKMVDTVYSHVADDYEYMLRQAAKDVEPEKSP